MDKKGTSNMKIFDVIFNSTVKYFKWFVLVSLMVIALSGVYQVESGEVAVVYRFGKIVGDTQEAKVKQAGLHFAFPFIIDEVVKIPVERVQERNVRVHHSAMAVNTDVRRTGYVITGDNNIVHMTANVRYRIDNPVDYSIISQDIDSIIDGVVGSESTALVANMTIDSVLTTDKNIIAENIKNLSQTRLSNIRTGIEIVGIEVTITPPANTMISFNKVNEAKITKQTQIQTANQYYSSQIPKAQTDAGKLVQNARINQQNSVAFATGEMAEFYGLYQLYIENPEAMMDTTFRQRLSEVLNQSGAVIIVPEDGSPPMIVLP